VAVVVVDTEVAAVEDMVEAAVVVVIKCLQTVVTFQIPPSTIDGAASRWPFDALLSPL